MIVPGVLMESRIFGEAELFNRGHRTFKWPLEVQCSLL